MKKVYSVLLLSFILFFNVTLMGQQAKPDWHALHYLSKEEMRLPASNSRNFTPTDPPEGFVRNVAEFDQMQAVLVRYPFGVPVSLIQQMAENDTVITLVANAAEQNTVTGIYQNNSVDLNHCKFLYVQTDSYWVRDYGPWFVFNGDLHPGIVDFPYNRPRPNDNNVPAAVAAFLGIDLYGMNLTTTGGNYMCSGMGQAASTDLVYDENPSYSHAQIDTLIKNYLGNDPYHVTIDPLGLYIKHIDCWGKFLAPDKILIGQVPFSDPRYGDFEMVAAYYANQTSSWGDKYKVYRVYTPGTSPGTPYSNSLILNNKVFVPITGSPWDTAALNVYKQAMPGYQIIGVPYNDWMNTDALHCRTKGVADLKTLYLWHIPVLGDVPYQESYNMEATLYNASGQSIYTDSALIYYKVNSGDWQTASLSHQYDYYWSGSLSGFNPGDTVRYYLFAADHSGRRSFQPRMADADPWQFVVGQWEGPQLVFSPDTIWFQNDEQMEYGLPLDVINRSPDTAFITTIQDFGIIFPWYIDTLPLFPDTLLPEDTLRLTVFCNKYVSAYESLLYDTIHVYTTDTVYGELTMIEEHLLDAIKTNETPEFHIFPNPFSKTLSVSYTLSQKEEITFEVYNLTGKQLLYKTISVENNGVIRFQKSDFINLPQDNGVLLYRLKAGQKTVDGELLFVK